MNFAEKLNVVDRGITGVKHKKQGTRIGGAVRRFAVKGIGNR